MQKLHILASLTLLLSIVGGREAFSQCSYISKNKLGPGSAVNIPCDFPVLITTGDLAQDTLTYKSAAIEWNNSHPTLPFVSVLPQPVATGNFIEIPASIFRSFTSDKQTALRKAPYYYKIKL
jgi:hypothetical protein